MRRQILSISYDPVLLRTRQLLLEGAGYTVTSVQGFSAAVDAIQRGDFDLAILGHSIPPSHQQAIIAEINKRCIPTLALLRPHEGPIDGATRSIDAGHPLQLIAAVQFLLPEDAPATKAKSA